MRVPISWLKDYVEIKETPQELAESLLLSGTKVEKIEKAGDDTIFDLEITPNRADCLSVIGIAREIAAIYDRKLILPAVFSAIETTPQKQKEITLTVEDSNLCPYFSLGVIDNVSFGKSPTWLSSRLEKSGIRSINNIVDISNFVMLETGQPMHTFDYDKIVGKMIMRNAKEGERVVTLDGVERKLPSFAIIIEDKEKLIDLAGIMGGENTEVSETTKTVALHVPIYEKVAIRKTSKFVNLRSEASNRFEKNLDPAGHRFAFERAAELFRILAGGTLASEIESVNYPPKPTFIETEVDYFTKNLGIDLPIEQIKNILLRLEFAVSEKGKVFTVEVPSFRTDVREPIDLVEEVGRTYGYNKFPRTLPSGQPSTELLGIDIERFVKEKLAILGFKETYTSTLTSAIVLESLGIESQNCLAVSNRLVTDYEYLRPTILTGLISAAAMNTENYDHFKFFEIGKVFEKKGSPIPNQPKKIGAFIYNSTFFEAKGIVTTLLSKLNVRNIKFRKLENIPFYDTGSTAEILTDEKAIGQIGRINRSMEENFSLLKPSFFFELDYEVVVEKMETTKYQKTPTFPVVKENISLFLPSEFNFQEVEKAITEAAKENLFSLELIEDLELNGKRTILVGLEYFEKGKTLEKEEIDKIRSNVIEKLEEIGAVVRKS